MVQYTTNKLKVLQYIKNHSGMSASISVVARAIKKDFRPSMYSSFVAIIRQLKREGEIQEIKGRYYA